MGQDKIKDRILNDFQMMTVFTEVENIVNNRPLKSNCHNVKDFEALTPNHFLIRKNVCNSNHLCETRANDLCSRKRWRQVQVLIQNFWSHWLKEYLPTFTRHVKWQCKSWWAGIVETWYCMTRFITFGKIWEYLSCYRWYSTCCWCTNQNRRL